jgi:hypothetical protein
MYSSNYVLYFLFVLFFIVHSSVVYFFNFLSSLHYFSLYFLQRIVDTLYVKVPTEDLGSYFQTITRHPVEISTENC